MGRMDKTFKPKLNEEFYGKNPSGCFNDSIRIGTDQEIKEGFDNSEEEFVPTGSYTVSNSGGYEVMISRSGDAAKVRDAFGSDTPQTSDWLEIEYIDNHETGESEPVIDPNGYNIPLNQVMRMREGSVREELSGKFNLPDQTPVGGGYSKGEFFEDKLEEIIQQMIQSDYGYQDVLDVVQRILQKQH